MSVKGTWSRIKDQAAVDATYARMAETKRLKAAGLPVPENPTWQPVETPLSREQYEAANSLAEAVNEWRKQNEL